MKKRLALVALFLASLIVMGVNRPSCDKIARGDMTNIRLDEKP